jgi:hypothetical protein
MGQLIATDAKSTDPQLAELKKAIQADCLALPTSAPGGRGRRNALAMAYMLVVDQAYDTFETAMLQESRTGNFVATITSLGLATAGGVAGGKTAGVLSAANTGVIGEREAFSKEFLFSLTVPALQNQMRGSRAVVRTRIYDRMAEGLDVWSTCMALQDLNAYEHAGTIAGALVDINETTAIDAAASEEAAQAAVERFKFDSGGTAEALRAYFNPADDALQAARIAKAKGAAMTAANLAPPPGKTADEFLGRILSDPAYAAQQRALLLGILATETDPVARAPLIKALAN